MVALGSVLGSIKNTIDELRDGGMRVGILGITTFRPFPARAIRDTLGTGRRARRLVVLERALAAGMGGIVSADLRMALSGDRVIRGRSGAPIMSTVIAGLGGRPITRASLRNMLAGAAAGTLEPLSFLDLNKDVAEHQFTPARRSRRAGVTAGPLSIAAPVTGPGGSSGQ